MNQCKLCAEFKNETINVKNQQAVEKNLEIKIEKFLKVTFTNGFTEFVCTTCSEVILTFAEFHERVLKAQSSLIFQETQEFNERLESFSDWHGECSVDSADNENNSKNDDTAEDNVALSRQDKRKSKGKELEKACKIKVKRKLTKEDSANLNPEKVQWLRERSELIKRIKDEWKTYKWICVICKEELCSVEKLNSHFEKNHGEPPRYFCNECTKVIPKYNYFKRHVAVHRNKFKYKCEICYRFFARSYHYRTHLETHSTEKKYMCSHCGKYYKTSNSLQIHIRAHTLQPIKRDQFECDICHKKLLSKSSLYCHKKIHVGKRDYTCEQCGRAFLFLYELKNHIALTHSDLKPFCCPKCNKLFKSSALLRAHQEVHTDERKHACDVCGKKFHRKETLRRHSTVHTGILAFPCESCSKRFRTKQLLRVHTRQHTGERPYACEECNHRFVDSSNYIKHMKSKHGITSIRKNVQYKTDISSEIKSLKNI